MSHELRTPLNAILARTEALEEGIYGPVVPDQVATLHGIEESGRHLLALINDILDLSKIEAGQLELQHETVEADMIGTLSLRMVSEIALKKGITLTSDYDLQIQTLQADERRLKQILVNLLSNAVKLTPQGGKVGLTIRGSAEQETITFTVWDTGIGIVAEDMPKLFQPFVQLDSRLSRQYSGTGLGLSLVARLAKAHGGSIAVESAPGAGSSFGVTLPVGEAREAARPAPQTAGADRGARQPIRQVLLVEDSPVTAEQLKRYLHELGASVEVLPHGTRVIEQAAALQPDVILLDILLPGNDGWQVLRALKAARRTQAIPIVIVSLVDDPQQAQELGAAALLVKPVDRVMLEQTVRRVLARTADPLAASVLIVAPARERPTILLAADNEANIATITDYLLAKGYEVLVARNGNEAVMRAQEQQPDAILMDIQMPGKDGLEAIRRIRATNELARVPIVAVTALAMSADRERCLAAGADTYLPKPVSLRNLVTAVEELRASAAGPGRSE